MSRFFRLALGAVFALSLAAASVIGCSDDDQSQQQQQTATAEQQSQPQQQQSESSASTQTASTQEQQSQSQAQQQSQAQGQSQAQPQAVSAEPLNVVVSTQVIADWVRQIGGDLVNVYALVPAGADAHILELTSSDVRAIADADLVVINGGGIESYYEDLIRDNAENILYLTEAIESAGYELLPYGALSIGHDDEAMHDDDHGSAEAIGRLLIADAIEAHLSVIDLSTEEVNSGLFSIAAPNATVYSSPTHRYGIVLARGPADGDDRIHVFDGGVFLVPHGDHSDLIREPVSRHALEIIEEWPVHYVNSHGWTTIFADTNGHVVLINEQDLVNSRGDYEPIVLDAGFQHGAAFVIADDHVILSSNNPACTEFIPGSWDCLPLGVEVRTFDNEVVYDASNRACPSVHGEAHNSHGAIFGCIGGVLFVDVHDGQYEHEFIPYPPETNGEVALGQYYGHHHSDNFFAPATLFPDGQCCDLGGVWMVDVVNGEMREIFPEPSASAAFSSDGETFYTLAADGVLRAFDAHDGELIGTTQLVDPFEIVFGSPTPAIIVVGEMLYVADPNSGHVLAVHLDDMEIEEEWEVDGAPSSLAFVGVIGSGDAPDTGHDDEDDHDEEEHEEGEEHEEEEHEEDEHGHEDEEDDHGHAHDHGDEDPHFWFDADLAAVAIRAISDELVHLNPDGADVFSDRLELYLDQVAEADAEARALIASVPEHQRLLVTFHDAFGYFARRYDLQITGFLIEGPEQGISAEAIADLIELIEHEGVQTVFHEPQFDSSSLDTVASETGATRGTIWSQPTEDNPTYIGILLGNAQAIADQ